MKKMTKQEALELLKDAPRSTTDRSAINNVLTQWQAYDLVYKWVNSLDENARIGSIMAKRVYQVAKNHVRPQEWVAYQKELSQRK